MQGTVRAVVLTMLGFSLMIAGSPFVTLAAQAEEPGSELVPEPWVHETHQYDKQGEIDGKPTDEYFVNEGWSIEVRHGDVMTLIMARNITQGDVASVDYTNNIHYDVDGKLYIAQFMIMELVFNIGGSQIHSPLNTCTDFQLEYSQTRYDDATPTLDCNITYQDIRIYSVGTYPAQFGASTVDLTLVHHIRCDWNNTSIKIEAILDFSDTRFYDPNDGNNEFAPGAPFVAEVGYMMMLANPEDFRTIGPVIPTSVSNMTLEYNMTLNSGSPLTVSKLEMKDDFTIFNGSGSRQAVGYSSMELHGGQAHVTHGFPDLSYKETVSMMSDPEVTVFHDRVTETVTDGDTPLWMIIPLVAAAAIAAAVILIFLKKRKSSPR